MSADLIEDYENQFGSKPEASVNSNDASLDQDEIDNFIHTSSFDNENNNTNISIDEYERIRKEEESSIMGTMDCMFDIPQDMKLSDIEPSNKVETYEHNSKDNFIINVEKDSINIDDSIAKEEVFEAVLEESPIDIPFTEVEEIVDTEDDTKYNEIIDNKNLYLDEEKLEEMASNLNLAISGKDNIESNDKKNEEELLAKKTLEDYEKEKRRLAIVNMGNKYGLSEIEVKEKIQKYVDFTRELRELEKKEADINFIKTAISEKKKKDEDDKLSQGISKILSNVQQEIQNDNFLETVDKNSVYRNIFLSHIVVGVLDYINHSESNIEKENVEKKELFDIFANKYKIRTCEMNKNAYLGMFLNENSLENYISLMSYFFNNDLIRKELKILTKDLKSIDLSLDKIYYI